MVANSNPTEALLAIIAKYDIPPLWTSLFVSSIVKVYMNKIALWIVSVKKIGQPNEQIVLVMVIFMVTTLPKLPILCIRENLRLRVLFLVSTR